MLKSKYLKLKTDNKFKYFEDLVERHSIRIKHLLLTKTSIGTAMETLITIDKQNGIHTNLPAQGKQLATRKS
jgi:hypothetical protein